MSGIEKEKQQVASEVPADLDRQCIEAGKRIRRLVPGSQRPWKPRGQQAGAEVETAPEKGRPGQSD